MIYGYSDKTLKMLHDLCQKQIGEGNMGDTPFMVGYCGGKASFAQDVLDIIMNRHEAEINQFQKWEAEEAEQDRRDAERAAGADDDFNQDTDFNFIQEGA